MPPQQQPAPVQQQTQTPQGPPVQEGNGTHGSHWEIVGLEGEAIHELLQETLTKGEPTRQVWRGYNIETQQEQDNELISLIHAPGDMQCQVLLVNGSLWSAYPVPQKRITHPLEGLGHIIRWTNRIEGQWQFKVLGASLAAFDPNFYNQRGEVIPRTNQMHFSAIAYGVRKHQRREQTKKGTKFSKDFAAILPASFEGAFPDDWMFIMPVRERQKVDIFSQPGYCFTGPLFHGVDGTVPFTVPVYVLASNIPGEVPEIGDSIEGSLWLQGSFDKSINNERPSK